MQTNNDPRFRIAGDLLLRVARYDADVKSTGTPPSLGINLASTAGIDAKMLVACFPSRVVVLAKDAKAEWTVREDGQFHPNDSYVRYDPGVDSWWLYADPMGRSTFFYRESGAGLIVSDSILPVLPAHPTANSRRVFDYISCGYPVGLDLVDSDETFVHDVKQVPPGSVLTVRRGVASCARYWRPELEAEAGTLDSKDAAASIRKALEDSVGDSLMGAGTVAVSWSGGLDSSFVGALAQRFQGARGGDLHFVSAGGGLDTEEERQLRKVFARTAGGDVYVVKPGRRRMLEAIRQENAMTNHPVGGLWSFVFRRLREFAKSKDVTCWLDGNGGDEMFGENPLLLFDIVRSRDWQGAWENYVYHASRRTTAGGLRRILAALIGALGAGQGALRGTAKSLLSRMSSEFYRTDFGAQLLGLYGDSEELVIDQRKRIIEMMAGAIDSGWALSDFWHWCRLLRIPYYGQSADDCELGLTTHSPIADPRVFGAMIRVRYGERETARLGTWEKNAFRLAARGVLPMAIRDRPKIGRSDLFPVLAFEDMDEMREMFNHPMVSAAGIRPTQSYLYNNQVLGEGGLQWMHVVCFSIWWDGLQRRREMQGHLAFGCE